jgi:hypothetical protein
MVKILNMFICVKIIIKTLTKVQTSPYEKKCWLIISKKNEMYLYGTCGTMFRPCQSQLHEQQTERDYT